MSNSGLWRLMQSRQLAHRRWYQLSQCPSVIEAQPIFNERGVRRFEPDRQHLWVDRPQVFARTGTQGAGEANEIVSRSRRARRPRRSRSIGSLWGRRCPPDNLEF